MWAFFPHRLAIGLVLELVNLWTKLHRSVADLGGARGGIATPEKGFHHFLIICYYNQYSITYILSTEKEIAQDLQDEDIIHEFAANEKKKTGTV